MSWLRVHLHPLIKNIPTAASLTAWVSRRVYGTKKSQVDSPAQALKPETGVGFRSWAPARLGTSTWLFLAPYHKPRGSESVELGSETHCRECFLQCRHFLRHLRTDTLNIGRSYIEEANSSNNLLPPVSMSSVLLGLQLHTCTGWARHSESWRWCYLYLT